MTEKSPASCADCSKAEVRVDDNGNTVDAWLLCPEIRRERTGNIAPGFPGIFTPTDDGYPAEQGVAIMGVFVAAAEIVDLGKCGEAQEGRPVVITNTWHP